MNTYSNPNAPYQPSGVFNYAICLRLLDGSDKKRTACPLCSYKRTDPKDPCLVLKKRSPTAIGFVCHNCKVDGWFVDPETDEEYEGEDPVDKAKRERAAEAAKRTAELKVIDKAMKIWGRAKPLNARSEPIARAYFEGRGLDFIDVVRRQVRYLPDFFFFDVKEKVTRPALAMPIRSVMDPARLVGVQVTPLNVSPDGRKAEIYRNAKGKSVRRTEGVYNGRGVIMLGRAGEDLAIAEGLETAMGVLKLGKAPTGRIWAVLGTSGMENLPVLEVVKRLTVFADADPPDDIGVRSGSAAALGLTERYLKAGKAAEAWRPLEEHTDYADMAAGKCWPRETQIRKLKE